MVATTVSVDIDKIIEKEQEQLRNFGYYIHFVNNEKFFDIHTHGLLMNFGILDLQLIVPYGTEYSNGPEFLDDFIIDFFSNMCKYAMDRNNDPLCDNDFSNLSLPNKSTKKIKFKVVKDNDFDRMLLRAIFPDNNGKYPWDDDCDELYKLQFSTEDLAYNKRIYQL